MLGKYAIASIGKQISSGDISSEFSEIERKKAAKDAVVAFSTGSKNAKSLKSSLFVVRIDGGTFTPLVAVACGIALSGSESQ
jgi:hypothetical protein